MRNGSRIAACLLVAFCAAGISADVKKPSVASTPVTLEAPRIPVRPLRVLSFRSLAAEVDNHVVANLLAEIPARPNDMPLSVVAGEIGRCEAATCVAPLTVRVSAADGPVTVAFAVANPRGELSDVRHAECGTGACNISLVLERGMNTISIGVIDGLAKSTAYTTLHVDADHAYASAGRAEWF